MRGHAPGTTGSIRGAPDAAVKREGLEEIRGGRTPEVGAPEPEGSEGLFDHLGLFDSGIEADLHAVRFCRMNSSRFASRSASMSPWWS